MAGDLCHPIGNYSQHSDCSGISEGIADYLGIDYRRHLSLWNPNNISHWYNPSLRESIQPIDSINFQENWYQFQPYESARVWASTLMDLQYEEAANPSLENMVMERDIIVTLQFASISALNPNNQKEDYAYAIYQADQEIYNGIHIRHIIKVFNDRLMCTSPKKVYSELSNC